MTLNPIQGFIRRLTHRAQSGRGGGGGVFVGPYVLGVMREMTGGFAAGMAALAIGPILPVTIVLLLGRAGSRLAPAKS